MSIAEMHDSILRFGDKDCGQGATAEEIRAAEGALDVPFSTSYRDFLKKVGWARFSHHELYGLGLNTPSYLQLVTNTVLERSQMLPRMPSHLVPVMNDGAGNHYCLDTSQLANGECPVVFWDHEQLDDQAPLEMAASFDRWLVDLLAQLPE